MTKSPQLAIRTWMDVFMHRSMRGWNQYAKGTGLSMPQVSILMQIHYRGACGLSAISERFDISNAAASQLVDKLVHSSHLVRTEDPSDRRAKLLDLSPKGHELIEQGINERYHWMDEVAKSLSAEDKAKVTEALNILTEAVKRLENRE